MWRAFARIGDEFEWGKLSLSLFAFSFVCSLKDCQTEQNQKKANSWWLSQFTLATYFDYILGCDAGHVNKGVFALADLRSCLWQP